MLEGIDGHKEVIEDERALQRRANPVSQRVVKEMKTEGRCPLGKHLTV